jgi:D-alanyl-D-alanine carboxypeptidase
VKSASWNIHLSKTGYIREAGKCLVMLATIASKPFVIVLLDSAGKYTRAGRRAARAGLARNGPRGRARQPVEVCVEVGQAQDRLLRPTPRAKRGAGAKPAKAVRA